MDLFSAAPDSAAYTSRKSLQGFPHGELRAIDDVSMLPGIEAGRAPTVERSDITLCCKVNLFQQHSSA